METDLPAIAKQIRALDKSDLKNWLRRGELLNQARELIAEDAGFLKWLRSLQTAKSTAYKAMAAWRDFGNVPTSGRFSKEAMAVLAQSPAARAEAIDLSGKNRITAKVAKELVAKYTPKILADSTPAEPRMYERILIVDDCAIILKFPTPRTAQELLSLMALGARELKAEQSIEARPVVPASPLDRLRTRLAG